MMDTKVATRISYVTVRDNWISIAVVVGLVATWEIAGHLAPTSALRDSPIIPPWEYVFGHAFLGLSDYWRIDRWAPVPQLGGEQTALGALLAISYHSAVTIYRLIAGFLLGSIVGTLLGLALSWSALSRGIFAPSLSLIRMCPLLAMIPLFQFWFGATDLCAIAFVAYGVGVIYLVGTVNAVGNLPLIYIESARVQGADKLALYRQVIIPGIMPELFSSVFLAVGISWGAVIGAEYVGVEDGLGRMMIWSEFFSNTGRMVLLTIVILIYATVSYWMLRRVEKRVLKWMPLPS